MTHSDKAPTAEQAMVRRIMNDNAEYMNGVDRGQVRFGHAAVQRMIEAAIRETSEGAANLAETFSFGTDIDVWMNLTKKEISALSCNSIALAIRADFHLKGETHD